MRKIDGSIVTQQHTIVYLIHCSLFTFVMAREKGVRSVMPDVVHSFRFFLLSASNWV